MTNEEFYKDELEEILIKNVAIDKDTGAPIECTSINCTECVLSHYREVCDDKIEQWLKAEHVEPEPQVDWSKVKVDTPIYVRYGEEDEWKPRHFAKHEDGIIYAWMNGGTSFSKEKEDVVDWTYAKLAESVSKILSAYQEKNDK